MAARKRYGIKHLVTRLLRFMSIFTRNPKGIAGLSIIIFFVVIAVAAPLITPYTPLGEDPNRVLPPANVHAAPLWLKDLPTYLGGNPDLSVTLIPIENPANPKTTYEGGEFKVEGDSRIKVNHTSGINFKYSSEGSGSLSVRYEAKSAGIENISITVFKEFYYPYSGPPGHFIGSLMLLINGTASQEGKLNIPVKISMFLQAENGTKMKIYPPPGYYYDIHTRNWHRIKLPTGFTAIEESTEVIIDKPLSGSKSFDGWIVPVRFRDGKIQSSDISSRYGAKKILEYEYGLSSLTVMDTYFKKTPGDYKIGVEFIFLKGNNTQIGDETTVYIDEIDIILLGTCFGLLGTNHQAQDLFSQLVYGTRVSLYVGLLSAAMAISIGLIVGLLAGFLGGVMDEGLMRINDFMLVIPGLPLLMVLVTIAGTSVEILILLLGLLGWNGFARLVRSQVLSLKERPFIEATRAVGASNMYIIFRHLVPNVMPLVYVSLATSVPGAITAEAALSWLGFFDPNRISWGRMLHDFQLTAKYTQWWWVVTPGLCIAALAVSFILLGFALDEILNPKLRIRR